MNHCKIGPRVALSLLSIGLLAASGCAVVGSHHATRSHSACPQCHSGCELKVEEGEEERHCWQVEKKEICIPRVVFPWQQRCCDPSVNNGAAIKTVRVLKKHEYQCPVCEYRWSPKLK